MVSFLCEVSGFRAQVIITIFLQNLWKEEKREKEDLIIKGNILKAFNFKRRKKGARQIKMTLEGQFKIVYNLKRIRRIMKKYKIVCPIRKANPYRKMMKATQEHTVVLIY